jgi:hypothetical protein
MGRSLPLVHFRQERFSSLKVLCIRVCGESRLNVWHIHVSFESSLIIACGFIQWIFILCRPVGLCSYVYAVVMIRAGALVTSPLLLFCS